MSEHRATIHVGDVLEVCRGLPSESFDACLTDPPYGLGFMGKRWDHGVPSAEVWREVSRVLRPGAHLLAFGGTRTYHRLACAIEDAGLEVRDCLLWLYGSGFPKSLDISKAIDKAAGVERSVTGPNRWEGLHGQENTNTYGQASRAPSTAPATPEGRRWDGYGTALKPAWEPVILAMKPLDGTFAGNALKHGVAGLWVDGGRIETGDEVVSTPRSNPANRRGVVGSAMQARSDVERNTAAQAASVERTNTLGRWPANVLLDEDAAALLDREVGEIAPAKSGRVGRKGGNAGSLGAFAGSTADAEGHWPADAGGGPSRFFYTAKASRAERGDGNHHPTVKPLDLTAYLARLILPPERGAEPRRLVVPFSGSGSEIIGAFRAGWEEAVGIELDPEYAEIARRRIQGDAPLFNRAEIVSEEP